MKRILAVFGLVSFLFGFQAGAESDLETWVCRNGSVEEVGDSFFQVTIFEDGLAFEPYEARFALDFTEVNYASDTFSIVNKTVNLSIEGQETTSLVNAIMIFNRYEKSLSMAISYDKGPFTSYELSCSLN